MRDPTNLTFGRGGVLTMTRETRLSWTGRISSFRPFLRTHLLTVSVLSRVHLKREVRDYYVFYKGTLVDVSNHKGKGHRSSQLLESQLIMENDGDMVTWLPEI